MSTLTKSIDASKVDSTNPFFVNSAGGKCGEMLTTVDNSGQFQHFWTLVTILIDLWGNSGSWRMRPSLPWSCAWSHSCSQTPCSALSQDTLHSPHTQSLHFSSSKGISLACSHTSSWILSWKHSLSVQPSLLHPPALLPSLQPAFSTSQTTQCHLRNQDEKGILHSF